VTFGVLGHVVGDRHHQHPRQGPAGPAVRQPHQAPVIGGGAFRRSVSGRVITVEREDSGLLAGRGAVGGARHQLLGNHLDQISFLQLVEARRLPVRRGVNVQRLVNGCFAFRRQPAGVHPQPPQSRHLGGGQQHPPIRPSLSAIRCPHLGEAAAAGDDLHALPVMENGGHRRVGSQLGQQFELERTDVGVLQWRRGPRFGAASGQQQPGQH